MSMQCNIKYNNYKEITTPSSAYDISRFHRFLWETFDFYGICHIPYILLYEITYYAIQSKRDNK